MALGLLLANILVSGCRIWYVRKTLPDLSFDWRDFDRSLFRQMLLFGSMMFVLAAGGQIILNTDNIVIAKFLGLTLVASYAIAFRVNQVAVSFIYRLADTFFPFYAELHAQGDREKLRLYLFESSQFSAVIAFFMFLFMVFWGKPIISLWLGQENFIGRPVFFLLALIVLMGSLVHLPAVVLQGMGKLGSVVGFNLAEAAINLGLSLLLVVRFGVLGVALGTVIAMALTSLWYVPYLACRETQSSFRTYLFSTVVGPACLAALTAVVIALLESVINSSTPLNVLFKAFIALAFYLSIFLRIGLSAQRRAFYLDRFSSFRKTLFDRGSGMNYEQV